MALAAMVTKCAPTSVAGRSDSPYYRFATAAVAAVRIFSPRHPYMRIRFDCRGLTSSALFAALFGACAPAFAQPAAAPARAAAKPVAGFNQGEMFQIVLAEIALQRGQFGAAWSTYMDVARKLRDPRLAKRAVEIAYASRALDQAIESAKLWNELQSGDAEIENTLVSLYVEGGRLADTEPLIAKRLAQSSEPAVVFQDAQRLFARAADKSSAFATLDRLSHPYLRHAGVRLGLARGAAMAGFDERALTEARAAMAIEPASEIAALTTSRLLLAKSPGEAARLLQDFIDRNPKTVEVRIALGRTFATHGEYLAAHEALAEAGKLDPANLEVLLLLGLVSAQAHDYANATRELQGYLDAAGKLEERPEGVDSALFALATVAEDQHRFDEANAYLDRIEPGERYLDAQTRIARNLARSNRLDDARTLLHALPARDADEEQSLVMAEAQVLREARHYREAFEVLEGGLKIWPDAPALLYDYALAAEKVERTELMEATLRRVITLKPGEPQAYNALGYWLADTTARLDEAEVLIEKALSLAPDDAFIIDSMGWLQYRRGRNDRAIALLERAYRIKSDPEIGAHLGEVYWVSGMRDKAEIVWRAAHARDPENETLAQTLARYTVKF